MTTNGTEEPRANTEEWALGASKWKGTVNALLYAIQFRPVLDAEEVNDIAEKIIDGQVLSGGAARYAGAIHGALAQDGPIDDVIETPHSDAALRAFLAQVQHLLEQAM